MVSVKGKSNAQTQNRVAEVQPSRKNVGIRNFKVYSDAENIKTSGRETVDADSVKIARKPVMAARKSVPLTKEGTQANSRKLKGSPEKSEKIEGKRDGSDKINVGRKVLADISNVRSYLFRDRASAGSKPVVSIAPSTGRVRASSRKPDMGKTRANQFQGAENHHTLKKVGVKDFKVNSNNQKLKGQCHESVGTDGRMTARKPLMPIRKSLPVTRRANQIYSSDAKGYTENSKKGSGKYGFHVKTKVGGILLPEISNARSYLLRNRASDGFLSMAPVDQSTVNACALLRKPVRPIVRTTRTTSNIQLTSKSKSTLSLKKSITATARSSKNAEEVEASSIHENIPLVVPHESTQGKLPSDKNSYLNTNTSDIISRSKCNRRRSYTSLLMEKSKVIGVHAIIKQEELPSIDDNSNHLEVAEYVDEIYQYYWVMEAQNPSPTNYMTIQTDLTPKMRGIVINWLIEVHLKFDLMQETLFLTVTLLDKFLSIFTIKKNEMQLVGLTALLLASKYEDLWHPKVKDLISISADSYTRKQMLGMEKLILKELKFRLNAPTSYVFMLRFLKAAQSDTKFELLAFYLIELCLVEYEALKFNPSLLCASAIYVARCTLHMTPAWTTLLGKHARYEESQLRDCAEMILRFQKSAGRGLLKVTYEKYVQPDRSCVAAITTMDRLPL